MANASIISGLRPVRNVHSGNYIGSMAKAHVAAADAVPLAVGDTVKLAGEANPALISGYSFNEIEGAYPTVEKADPGDAVYGVVGGFEPRAVVGYEQAQYREANVEMYVLVHTDPTLLYEVQAQTGTAFTGAMVGQTCSFVNGTIDTVYGRSGLEADLTTVANAANTDLLILGLQDRAADNEVGDLAKLLVKLNNTVFGTTTVGA